MNEEINIEINIENIKQNKNINNSNSTVQANMTKYQIKYNDYTITYEWKCANQSRKIADRSTNSNS